MLRFWDTEKKLLVDLEIEIAEIRGGIDALGKLGIALQEDLTSLRMAGEDQSLDSATAMYEYKRDRIVDRATALSGKLETLTQQLKTARSLQE